MKKLLLALALVATSGAFLPSVALAQVNVNIVIGNAPPPPRYEVVPSPRSGYIWAPGYWNWNGSRHVWSNGHWERSRSGQYFTRSEWRQGNDGWRLHRGGWQRGNGNNGGSRHVSGNDYRDDGGKHKGKHQDKHGDKHYDKHGDKHHDKHDGKHNGHCPPGQAKKGNC